MKVLIIAAMLLLSALSAIVISGTAPAGSEPRIALAQSVQDEATLYWKDPDGRPAYSPVPARTPDGKAFVPVKDKDEPPIPSAEIPADRADAPDASDPKKIIYYRNPMGLPDTSPVPKKDWMGMDYIPVYEGDEPEGPAFRLSVDKIQRAGVRSEAATMRSLNGSVRAPGVAQFDERSWHDVVLRADAYVEELYVAENGREVKRGEPLFRIYSPDIVKAFIDFRVSKTSGDPQGGATRLRNLDVPEAIIEKMRTGQPDVPMQIDWPAPATGVVVEKNIVQGQKVDAGAMLYRIADPRKLWVIADVAEQDIGHVAVGDDAVMEFRAFPGEKFNGKVTFISPVMSTQTRTARVRVELSNEDMRIRRDMYADVTIEQRVQEPERIAVPNSAIMDSGKRQIVFVDLGEGRFEPREVTVGRTAGGFSEIKEGIKQGELIVTTANFLLDAESNLKAALKSFGDASKPVPPADGPTGDNQ